MFLQHKSGLPSCEWLPALRAPHFWAIASSVGDPGQGHFPTVAQFTAVGSAERHGHELI